MYFIPIHGQGFRDPAPLVQHAVQVGILPRPECLSTGLPRGAVSRYDRGPRRRKDPPMKADLSGEEPGGIEPAPAHGWRIRLDITSSSFPLWDRNLNTGNVNWECADWRPAMQTIYHDAEHPSHLILPIIPR